MNQSDPKEPTMADVARLANVGTMTVSRVLNGSAHVHPATAKRVYWAVETLNYRPNKAARTLRGLKSRSIGLRVPSLADPFFAICAHSINLVAQQNGYSMILTTSNGDPEVEYSQTRLDGYRNAHSAAGLPSLSSLIKLDCTSQEVATRTVKEAWDHTDPPTAYFCANNWMTKFLMRALVELGIRVPDQVAVIGFDEVEMADILQPRLTVVRQPVEEVGTIAANVLFDHLKVSRDARPEEGIRNTLPVDLILRDSSGCKVNSL